MMCWIDLDLSYLVHLPDGACVRSGFDAKSRLRNGKRNRRSVERYEITRRSREGKGSIKRAFARTCKNAAMSENFCCCADCCVEASFSAAQDGFFKLKERGREGGTKDIGDG